MKRIAVSLILIMAVGTGGKAWAGGEYAPGPVPDGAQTCGSYNIGSQKCIPDGDQVCIQNYLSGNTYGQQECFTAKPEGGVKVWTAADGQTCRQFLNPDGSPQSSIGCWWPSKPVIVKKDGVNCTVQEYTAGPNKGDLTPDPINCPRPSPDYTQKEWINP